MNSSIATRGRLLPSLSPAAAGALPLAPTRCATRQKPASRRSLELRVVKFRKEVLKYWKENGRHDLPWRQTRNPYKILVSEIMLQQTQVSRVSEKYREFLEVFPSVRSLARAPLLEVLKMWSGLGYNRRAKYLHDAAKSIIAKHGSSVPQDYASLRALPGVGDYTAKAIRVFAFNEPEILIETNIRTAYIHHFYQGRTLVEDSVIRQLAARASMRQDPRTWHWALMDYGTHLKSSGVRNNHRSAHYTRQSKFEGSLRQVRGAILRALSRGQNIMSIRNAYRGRFDSALASLTKDALIKKKRGLWSIC